MVPFGRINRRIGGCRVSLLFMVFWQTSGTLFIAVSAVLLCWGEDVLFFVGVLRCRWGAVHVVWEEGAQGWS